MEILMQAGVNPNIRASGSTPLHVAAEGASIEVISLLINAGGDPDTCNDDGLTPIQVAALRNNHRVVELLLPSTTPFPSISSWSVDKIIEFTLSKDVVRESQVKEATSLDLASLTRPESALVSYSAKKDSKEASLRGQNAYEDGDYIGAAHAYSKAIELDPTNATLWSNRSHCWLLLGMADDALEDAKQSRALRPDLGRAFYREGVALHELQRYFDAAIAFYKGANLEPDDQEYLRAFRLAVEEGMKSQGKPDVLTTARSRLNSLEI